MHTLALYILIQYSNNVAVGLAGWETNIQLSE